MRAWRRAMHRHCLGAILVVLGATSACGRSWLPAGAEGESIGDDSGVLLGSSGVPGSSLGSSTSSGAPGSSSGSVLSLPVDDGCTPSVAPFQPVGEASTACWDCASAACSTEIATCRGDCVCSEALSSALSCLAAGNPAGPCFSSPSDTVNDSAWSAVTSCIVGAGGGCGCPGVLSVVPGSAASSGGSGNGSLDASGHELPPGCIVSGGGFGDSPQCSSNVFVKCGGTQYEVVCQCPQATCTCLGPGSSAHVIPYSASHCPTCLPSVISPSEAADVFARCGFPE